MKRCPECRRDYFDETLLYCLDDGTPLVGGPKTAGKADDVHTQILPDLMAPSEVETRHQTNNSDAGVHVAGKSLDKRWLALPLAVLLIFGGIIGYRYLRSTETKQIESIAVMPFVNESGSADIDYLSDGMTETLISSLSLLPNLRVKARSAVFRYKGKETETKAIASELGVQAVLKGRIVQRGERLTLSLELIDGQTENVIWADNYDRSQKDLVTLQNEIALDVSSKLRSKLSSTDAAKAEKKNTADPEAYQFFLKGEYEWHKHTQEAVRKAIEYYNQALEKDPNYALAFYGLSASYGVLGNNYVSPKDGFPKANAYAAKALALDPALSEAHTALGAVNLYYEWNWAQAEMELKTAQSLDPGDVESHNVYSDYLDAMGRFDESQAERKTTQELDRLDPTYGINLGLTLYLAGKYDEAIAQFDRTITLEPHIGEAYLYRGQAFEQKKMYPQAIDSFQKGLDQGGHIPDLVAALGHAYALTGDRAKTERALAELDKMSKDGYVSPYYFSIVYLGLADKDKTFLWLEKAFQDRSAALIWLNVEPAFDPLRSDPRFKDLLKRMDLTK